jgi:hypothetical protein
VQLMKNRAWRVQNGRQLCVAATCFASAIFFVGISTNISRMMIYFNAKWNKRSLAVCLTKHELLVYLVDGRAARTVF